MANKSKIFEEQNSGYLVTLAKNETINVDNPEKSQNQRII